ncbi:unnamed protein product, partial [Cladocopium goreaui]
GMDAFANIADQGFQSLARTWHVVTGASLLQRRQSKPLKASAAKAVKMVMNGHRDLHIQGLQSIHGLCAIAPGRFSGKGIMGLRREATVGSEERRSGADQSVDAQPRKSWASTSPRECKGPGIGASTSQACRNISWSSTLELLSERRCSSAEAV